MRDRMERFVLLPFTVGCISESSIAVGLQQPKMSKLVDAITTPTRTRGGEKEDEDEETSSTGENLKSPSNLSALPKFQKLFKNFKNFSNLFVDKDELEEQEMGMEIGFPTDVKHVTHIGLDGCASSILSKGWNNLDEPFPLPPLEVAMGDQLTMRTLLQTK
ncbi:CRIB domain-containing protein RIC4 [Sesamum angolense]|uniref:CRIB domain-containing protein RIC4 n=1 Tax=Sesamum angolense TaxID=2727404 RepID=A0AAE1X200_9LAMI|nr:CRIB domain-containing protein RIC4 [Sesamum angolense]